MPNSHNPAPSEKVWFITGASTGFGRVLTEHLLAHNINVVATARNPDTLKDLEFPHAAHLQVLKLDVTKPDQVEGAIADALARFSHIDVLVNNAGYGLAGGIEEATEDEFMPMFETNVFGLIRVTRALLPHFRARRSGSVVNLSSIGGLIGGAGWGYYNATKFAVEGFSEALAAELAPLGIHVTIVEPGPFRTDFLSRSAHQAAAQIPDYHETVGKTREYFAKMANSQPGDPQRAVEAIIEAVNAPQPPKHLLLGKIALQRFRTRLQQWTEELDTWEAVTLGADFPDAG